MKKENPPLKKMRLKIVTRWMAEDYPGATPRFQIGLFAKDFFIFVMIPILAIVMFKIVEAAVSGDGNRPSGRDATPQHRDLANINRSQIIDFVKASTPSQFAGVAKKSPGALIKVKLLNVVETYSGAPVHAQVIDNSLGRNLIGGTLIGDATSDGNVNRINMEFRFVRDPNNTSSAIPISARALSLDGTLGVTAQKKEGFFARATLNSSGTVGDANKDQGNSQSLNQMIAKALTSGFLQEFGTDSQVVRNRSQVLTLKPLTEFYVELTDYFPGAK